MTNLWLYTDLGVQGIYRSEDGGENWQRVGPVDYLMDHNSASPNAQNRYTQHRFCWDATTASGPEAARRWYCIVNREVNPRHAPEAGSNLDGRLYRSDDGGRTWQPVRELDLQTYGRHDMLRHHPTAPGVLFLGSEHGLFKSTDGGRTFTRDTALRAGRVRTMDINLADPDDIYATVDDQGLYRTRDGGQVWQVVKEYRARGVAVHPTDRSVLYLYAAAPPKQNARPADAESSPLVSRDGGQSWTPSRIATEGEFAASVSRQYTQIAGNRTVVLPDPRDTMAANVQSEMAFYRTTDGGQTFRLALQGITGMLANGMCFDGFNPLRFATFNEDTSIQLTENGGRWFDYLRFTGILEYNPDAARVAPDRIPFSSVTAGDFRPMPQSQVAIFSVGWGWRTKLIRTTDAGQTWKAVDTQLRHNLFIRFHRQDPNVVYADWQRSDEAGETFHAIDKRVIGVFEANSDIVFGVGPDNEDKYTIYRSTDRGETWHPFAREANPRPLSPAAVFAVHPTDPEVIYTATRSGELARYDGKTGTWTVFDILSRAKRDDAPRREALIEIAIDPRNANRLYVLVQAVGSSVVFGSRDGGATWEDISFNLPRMGRFLTVHPLTSDVYFGCMGGGVYVLPQSEGQAGRVGD